MGDPELELLRKQRLAELKAGSGQFQAGDAPQQNAKAQEERQRAQEEAKNSILAQILDQSARARLNTLMLGKPEKGQMVESMLLQMARNGMIRGKITEAELIGLLEDVNKKIPTKSTTVKFDRRRAALDSDDDI